MTPGLARTSKLLKRPSSGMFLAAAALLPLAILAVTAWLQLEFLGTVHLRRQLVTSYERRLEMISLLVRIKDAETAQHAYILTGDTAFLQPYGAARGAVRNILKRPDIVNAEGPNTGRWATVRTLAERKVAEMDRAMDLQREGKTGASLVAVKSGLAQFDMRRIRDEIAAMNAQEANAAHALRTAFDARRAALRRNTYSLIALGLAGLLIGIGIFWINRRERHAALVAAFDEAGRKDAILDSTVDAILILNPSGSIEVVNAAATRMLGHSSEELDRRDIATLIDIAPGAGSFYSRIGREGDGLRQSFLADRVVRHRDGHEIPVDIALSIMHLATGDHIVVSLRNISERKRLEGLKDDLISTVSHELRTPLTSIVGSLGLMRAGATGTLPTAADRLVAIAENNSRRLIRLINDMLDIDRIASGKLALQLAPVDLRDVVASVREGSDGLGDARDVRLEIAVPPHPIMALGDHGRLVQVVTNLVSNAVRVAPNHSVVTIGLAMTDHATAHVTVDDSGPGVPLAFRDRIFGRFERADRHDGSVGAGLGLAISREIVDRHDGRLWFEDRPTGGTRFIMALPLWDMATSSHHDDRDPRADEPPPPPRAGPHDTVRVAAMQDAP